MSTPAAAAIPSAPSAAPIPWLDNKAQQRRLGGAIERAIARVVEHGAFLMGPEMRAFEAELAAYAGVRHVLSCASGTDALLMLLMAKAVGPGDAVLCPSFTFTATAEVVHRLGATAVFLDVGDANFNLDPAQLEPGLAAARAAGLRPVGIIPVDLFGQPADYDAIGAFARAHGLWVLADAAQSLGSSRDGRRVGTLGDFAATSFYPTKALGAYGDGGAIFTDDDGLREVLASIRAHGEGRDRYENVRLGLTGRMDTIQAAVLLEKLRIYDEEIAARNRVAERYRAGLGNRVAVPALDAGVRSNWACYTIQVDGRDALQAKLKAEGIPTMIYYPRPLHRQPPYRACPTAGPLAVTERLAGRVLSLPIHAYLEPETQDRIIAAIHDAL